MFLKEKFKLSSSVNQYVLAYFVFVLLFYGIRYTADWATYTRMIEHPELSLDLLFRFLAERVNGGWDLPVPSCAFADAASFCRL